MAEPNNNQMAFWEAMKDKYERRNESLRHQEICLRKRLEQLKQIMEKQKAGDDCDCVPEKLEKPSLVQCLVEKGKSLILGSCKCGDPKLGEELLCACHIQDPKTPLNVDPNLCPMLEPSPPEGCLNPTCDFYDPTLANLAENPSTFSLKTTDIYYMDKLADLVKAEKDMQEKIEDLEKREHSYLTAIHDLQEAMKKQPKSDPINKEFKRLTEGLEEENKKLRNELEDLRLELKHCFERVEGPLRRSLEDQRDKCCKLENDLNDLHARTKTKEDSYLKEINEVKAKLCQACCTMVDLNNVNSQLKNDLGSLQNKYSSLEDELLKQQLKEAENILKFKNALSRRGLRSKIQAKGDESDLSHIAKKLGDTLKEVCPCVSDVPSGLAETAENIRELTEFVVEKGAQHRKKRKGKIHQISTISCSCGSDNSVPNTPPRSQETESCVCSNSSLRIRPRIGQNDFENAEDVEFGGSSSATLVSVPTMNVKETKHTSTPKSTVKKTASKGCTCCPAKNDCDHPPPIRRESIETICGCLEVDTKRTGPSEEVIAVKNLGTLSIPPGALSTTKHRRDKLAVDTTCDVLDSPPKDIHVVTTIAKTGSLEITTEGPPGIIETKVNYLPDGKIEIVTKLIDRHNMENFLDGTLLHVPEGPPDCDESHTCEGQCDDRAASAGVGCPEVDCDQSKTCGGLCDNEVAATGEDQKNLNKKDDHEPPYRQVVVDNNFILVSGKETNPFVTGEWKNVKFLEDPNEETLLQDMTLEAKTKGKRQEKAVVHVDVTSEQEMFRLSSRQSLTDVEKCLKEDNPSSLVYPDVLDTISEGDEEQTDSSKTDNDSAVTGEEIEKRKHTEDFSEKKEGQVGSPRDDYGRVETAVLESTEVEWENKPQGTETPKNQKILKVRDIIEEFNKRQTKIQNDPDYKSHQDAPMGPPDTKSASQESRSPTIFKDISECQITESFFKVSQNLNVLNGRVTLKQSKSMYEKRGSRSEYLRICKSSTLSLGSLKVDLERLKLSSKDPNVSAFRSDDRGRVMVEEVQLLPITADAGKVAYCMETDEKMVSDGIKEGCKQLESIPDQTYQCYVCSCSNQKDNEDQQRKNPQNNGPNQDLEQRIDRLLEIDPLSACHNCQCGVNRQQRGNKEDCKCSRKKQEQPNELDQPGGKCKCGSQKDKPPSLQGPKHQGDNLEHGENCTCVDCICNPCNFKKGATTACDCEKCECEHCCSKDDRLSTLIAFEMPKPQEITVMNVRIPCDCAGKCACAPCMDDSKKPKRPSQQPRPQEASCKRCADRVPGAQRADIAVGSSNIKTEPRIALPDTWKNVVGCPCSPPPEEKKAVCDCKECECKPCGYPEKARKPCDCKPPKKEPKPNGPSGKCDCNLCQCEYCGDLSIGDFIKTESSTVYPSKNCDCKLCECLFCSDPKARNPPAVPLVEVVEEHIVAKKVLPGSQQRICGCRPKCLCDHCPVYEGKVGDASGPKCDCEKCECDPCFDSNPVKNLEDLLHKVKSDDEIRAVGKVPCDCGTCECDNCMGKRQDDEKSKGDTSDKKDKPKKPCRCVEARLATNEPITQCDDCAICCSAETLIKNIEKLEDDEKSRGDNFDKESATPTDEPQKVCPCMEAQKTSEERISCLCSPRNIPCDCCAPCPCSPCPDRNVSPQTIGDADRAKEEIKNVLNKIGCTCDQAEDNLKPLVKQASNFETTVSRMKMKLNNLQQKCRDKDQIIDAMTEELRMRSQSGVFADLLHDLAHPKERFTPDFTRTYVCDFLPKPRHGFKLQPKRSSLCPIDNRLEPILELDRYLPGTKDDANVCPKYLDVSGMEIIDIRRVTIDSILMKWRGPSNVNGVTGYQIFVNDELKYRVLSPNRTNAVIDSLDLSSSLEIMLFAITYCGRCEPPAFATYKI